MTDLKQVLSVCIKQARPKTVWPANDAAFARVPAVIRDGAHTATLADTSRFCRDPSDHGGLVNRPAMPVRRAPCRLT